MKLLKYETYIVCSSNLLNQLKTINDFKLDLGLSLINSEQKFNPGDIFITKHIMNYDEYIFKLGNIGGLGIYNYKFNTLQLNEIDIINSTIKKKYIINNESLFDFFNESLFDFMLENNIIKQEDIKEENIKEENIKEVNNKPQKPLSEMTMEERINYARSL